MEDIYDRRFIDSVKLPMINRCQDKEIKAILLFALEISEKCVSKIKTIYQQENHPVPTGFGNEDTNKDAPALFSDNFHLLYIHEMGKLGFRLISQASEITERKDVLQIFYETLDDYRVLYKRTLNLLVSKNLYPYSPALAVPKKVDFINKQSFLFNWFKKQRPLTAEELVRVHNTAHRNAISKALLLGFSKIVKDEEIKKYLERGIKNANKIIAEMEKILLNENLNVTKTYDAEVLSSTVPSYSEKLILVHVAQMGAGSIALYGTDLSTIMRKDIGMKYVSMIGESLVYSEDGMNLLIKKGWIEEPPQNER